MQWRLPLGLERACGRMSLGGGVREGWAGGRAGLFVHPSSDTVSVYWVPLWQRAFLASWVQHSELGRPSLPHMCSSCSCLSSVETFLTPGWAYRPLLCSPVALPADIPLVCAKLLQSCPTLCDPMDCSPPGSSVHGILQARMLEWVVMSFSRGFSWPRAQTHISCVSSIIIFTTSTTRKAPSLWYPPHLKVKLWVAQSCLTLCNPMDCSPPGSSIHWILQARILEWVAMPFSRGSSWPRALTHVSCVSCISRGVLHD